MSDENQNSAPPAPPGARPKPASAPPPAAPAPAMQGYENEAAKLSPEAPDSTDSTPDPAADTGPRLSDEPEPPSAKNNPGPGNPFADLDEMPPGYYQKVRPGRVRNPRTGLVFTHGSATQVVEADSWDRSQLKAGVIEFVSGPKNIAR